MIITLTTDFGGSDGFAGILKGVILGIAPDVTIVDLTHDIRSYDILEAAFVLGSAWRHFPNGTIHVVVVDPGVGSARRAVAVAANGHIFVGPDNGVLSFVLGGDSAGITPAAYELTNTSLFRMPVSSTFHGRDVFAPAAAHLAQGVSIDSAGPRISDLTTLPFSQPRRPGADTVIAAVLHIDKFGNVVTNLRRHDLKRDFRIHAGGREITSLLPNYAAAGAGELFAIEGSIGFIEIALNRGSAAEALRMERGAEIQVDTPPVLRA